MALDRGGVLRGVAAALCLAACPAHTEAGKEATGAKAARVDFARDVQPILSNNCFACHGPDREARKAGLRLDQRDSATKPAASGVVPITPGKSAASELVRRVLSEDRDEAMPPSRSKKKLTGEEKEILRRWIDQGAEYAVHWSFVKPHRPGVPKVEQQAWPRNPIDAFILHRLEREGLRPSPEADRPTLIRRLSFDLRGLPPTLAEVEAFLRDDSEDAYEKLVERMLASPHHGEKMAQLWLDLARYGDTSGFHQDSYRQMWLWRDWVIDAFNKNMPYDRFTIEQLAGDLLPEATISQKIASGFNRNTRFNEEGGVDPEEFVVRYNIDRASTIGQVWLGMTLGCAECHDHKYDPISQKEFYQLYAYFSGIKEPMVSMNHNQPLPPLLKAPTPEQARELARLEKELGEIDAYIDRALARFKYADPFEGKDATALPPRRPSDFVWIDDDVPPGATADSHPKDTFHWVVEPAEFIHSGKRSMVRTGKGLHQHFFTRANPPLTLHADDVLFTYVWLDPNNPPTTLMLQWHDGTWEHRAYWGDGEGLETALAPAAKRHRAGDLPEAGKWQRIEVAIDKVGFLPGAAVDGWAFSQVGGTAFWDRAGVHTLSVPDELEARSLLAWETRNRNSDKLPAEVVKLLRKDRARRTAEEQARVRAYFLHKVSAAGRESFAPIDEERDAVARKLKTLDEAIPHTLISEEMATPRPAHVLVRGDFLHKGEKVDRAVPGLFPSLPSGEPNNRLGLARWLMHPDQPLTARVAVNRFWAQMFGEGIVRTLGDFGVKGEAPSHPELLDWLAVEFREKGWDTRHVLRLIALSRTYRQASTFPAEPCKADPGNRLLWRMPRHRLTAEEIRDSALAASGLLTRTIGGPSVMPYQPADYFKGKFEGWAWPESKGEAQYRRGLYTFWRRTALHPMLALFDAPNREECVVARPRTNTALQALVTLNDPTFVEAARVFAQRILSEGPEDVVGRIRFAFRAALSRSPTPAEVAALTKSYEKALARYEKDRDAASKLVHVGAYPRLATLDIAEHAAWTAVGSILLNVDEAITRE